MDAARVLLVLWIGSSSMAGGADAELSELAENSAEAQHPDFLQGGGRAFHVSKIAATLLPRHAACATL